MSSEDTSTALDKCPMRFIYELFPLPLTLVS